MVMTGARSRSPVETPAERGSPTGTSTAAGTHALRRRRRQFAGLSYALAVLILGTNLPTPLYAVYRHEFGFSALILTLVFATYAELLIPALLVFGRPRP